LVSVITNAQEFQGKAYYQTKRKVDLKLENSEMSNSQQQAIQEMLKTQFERTYILTFNKETSTYKEEEKLETPSAKKSGMQFVLIGGGSGATYFKNTKTKYEKILSRLCMKLDASQGIVYSVEKEKNKRFIQLFASFAYNSADSENVRYELGEGLSGQVAKEGNKININNIPEGYITIISGLGASSPSHLAILPIKEKGEVVFVVEIASFHEISASDEKLIGEALTFKKVDPKPAKKELSDKEAGDQKKEKGK